MKPDGALLGGGRTSGRAALDWRVPVAMLLGLGVVHWLTIAGQTAGRGGSESLLAVAGFVALELLIALPLVPVVRAQADRAAARSPRRALRLVGHLAFALLVVALYRFVVLAAALALELGSVPPEQLVLWWRHAGPWQIQADLAVYLGAAALLVVRAQRRPPDGSDFAASPPGSGGVREAESEPRSEKEPPGRDRAPETGERITVRVGSSVHVLPAGEIVWIEGAGTYARLHTGSDSYLLRETLSALSDRLASHGFVRVHRSAVVNLGHLRSLKPAGSGRWVARMADGSSVRVAASRREELESAIGDSLSG